MSVSLLDRMEEIAEEQENASSQEDSHDDVPRFSSDGSGGEGYEDEDDDDDFDDEFEEDDSENGVKLVFTNYAVGVHDDEDEDEESDDVVNTSEEEGGSVNDVTVDMYGYHIDDPSQSAAAGMSAATANDLLQQRQQQQQRRLYDAENNSASLNVLYDYGDAPSSLSNFREASLRDDAFFASSETASAAALANFLSTTGGSATAGKPPQRSSFASLYANSVTDISINSAPLIPSEVRRSITAESHRQMRRVTIAVPKDGPRNTSQADNHEMDLERGNSRRLGGRFSTSRQSPPAQSSSGGLRGSYTSSSLSDDHSSSGSSILARVRSRATVFKSNTRSVLQSRRSHASSRGSSGEGSAPLDMAEAVDRLGSHERNSNWENAAAAAAVVAATTNIPASRKHVQFSKGDHVLVMLTLLNITNREDDDTHFTVDPVNVYGYPAGEGRTEEQRTGPYSFILCTVANVHFDEDERYYTVVRADTGSEQRADPPWMEPIRDLEGMEAAMRAAQRTRRSESNVARQPNDHRGFLTWVSDLVSWPLHFFQDKVIPCYVHTRRAAKVVLEHLLNGAPGYACRTRVTCINLLVICSFVFLFIDAFSIAYLPARLDRATSIVGVYVYTHACLVDNIFGDV